MENEVKIKYTKYPNADHLQEGDKKLYEAALEARENAYAPYSEFSVGCALLLENGEIVKGSNQENAAYPSGLCAERTAIFWTSANYPNVAIKKMFVIGAPQNTLSDIPIPPCGSCRQSILEYEAKQANPIELFFSSVTGEVIQVHAVRDLLPFSFDRSYL